MASSHATHHITPHHIPGIEVIYDPTNPKVSPYTPYTPPKSPKAHTHHQSPYSPQSFSHQASSTTQAIKDLQEEITKLQLIDFSRAEVITEQKIEIAVLKNDLEHARRDKEAVISSFGIVIESITRGACVTPSPQVMASGSTVQSSGSESRIKALEEEIERYRKSDRLLRSRIRDLERGIEDRGRINGREDDVGSSEQRKDVLRKEIGWLDSIAGSQDRGLDKGKGKMVEREIASGSGSGSANTPQCQQDNRHTSRRGPSTSPLARSWGEDSGYELPTIPNSPIAEPIIHPAHVDVGMCSLEDFLDNDGIPATISAQASSIPSTMVLEFPPSISAQSSSSSAGTCRLVEDERHIDEQIEENKKAMAAFTNMPTPGVIKTGFALEGSFRGADYDKKNIYPPARDFDRFAPNFRNSAQHLSRTGPGAAFGPPKDRSFEQGLWTDSQDRNGAVEAHMRAATGRNDTRFPDIFRYGIQYIPAEGDSNYMRTVQISNLALGTEVRDVLARVRGGDVLSAMVVKMGKIAPGTLQARVVFKHEAAAEDYVLYAAEHPILFGEDNIAEVSLVETPTFPLPARQITRLREQTRCIAVLDIPSYFSLTQLEHDLACGNGHRAQSLIEMWVDDEFTLHLQFANIDMAGSAWAILHAWNAYRGLVCKWEADPCAGEVEELANGVQPRPKILPNNWGMREQKETTLKSEGESGEGRKRLAALENQKVNIPDFNAAKLKTASWADEVNDELDDDDTDTKVEVLDELVVIGSSEIESSASGSSEGSNSAAGLSTPGVQTQSSPSNSANITSLEHRQDSNKLPAPLSSIAPVNSPVIGNPPITVLTVDQELQAALLTSNTNKDLANLTVPVTTPLLEKRDSIIGLAGSKYASDIPGFVDTGLRPRSININTSSSSASRTSPRTSPTRNALKPFSASEVGDVLPPGSNAQVGGLKLGFSASPPRIDLQCLIKSERSSFASAGTSGRAAEFEVEAEVDAEVELVAEADKKSKVQLFKWFQLPGSKKRGFANAEHDVYGSNLKTPGQELRNTSTKAEEDCVKVVKSDEIDLSGGEDEVIIEAEKDTISTSGTSASSSGTTDDGVLAVV